ncbi:uncharacterized protein LOC143032360 [Oratosquilla oratoria]|uniref:uncharacterized protein LOC143032360 n=1 Tax=Oratosquilla oratoria TaxID=337810 RepID=UPI003F76FA2A
MSSNKSVFVCEAVYRGQRAVQGSQTPSSLTAVVEAVVACRPSDVTINKRHQERCQLQCDEDSLRVTRIKKDEGFESDSESSGSACDDSCCVTQDIKVINDHVLRLDRLLREDSTSSTSSQGSEDVSSANTSGAESEDDLPRPGDAPPSPSPPDPEAPPLPSSNALAPPPSHAQPGDGADEVFLMSDILFCHVSPSLPRVVVAVVKNAETGRAAAHVFECGSEEAARTLYLRYHESSSRYKLNRYRNSWRRSGGAKLEVKGETTVDGDLARSSLRSVGGNSAPLLDTATPFPHNLPKISSKNAKNVNVIEIRETKSKERPWHLHQHTDENGVTHIEIESGPRGSSNSKPITQARDFGNILSFSNDPVTMMPRVSSSSLSRSLGQTSAPSSMTNAPSSLPATIISSGAPITSSAPSSLTGSNGGSAPSSLVSSEDGSSLSGSVRGREVLVAGEKDKKSRQRQPPLLLEESRRNEKEEEKRDWRREEVNWWGEEERERETRSRRDRHEGIRDSSRSGWEAVFQYPQERRGRDPSSKGGDRNRARYLHNKGPAPLPPPRRHPNNPSLLLIPTKSGAEPSRAFYPKETHIMRGGKLLRVDYPGYPGWGVPHQQHHHSHIHHHNLQQHHHHDVNNNPNRYSTYYPGLSSSMWAGPHEYHAPRVRESSSVSADVRRRSRSKSPARRPMAHRYIDAVAALNISQRLKDFSEAVFTSRKNQNDSLKSLIIGMGNSNLGGGTNGHSESKGHHRSSSTVSAPPMEGDGGTVGLKPVIKKGLGGRRLDGESPEARRVTFSAYATVQLMDT